MAHLPSTASLTPALSRGEKKLPDGIILALGRNSVGINEEILEMQIGLLLELARGKLIKIQL